MRAVRADPLDPDWVERDGRGARGDGRSPATRRGSRSRSSSVISKQRRPRRWRSSSREAAGQAPSTAADRFYDAPTPMADLIEKIGPIVGVVAFLGLAILAFLIFQQAREVRRLREWAGRAPERAGEAAEATAAAAEARGEAVPEDEAPELEPSERAPGQVRRVVGRGAGALRPGLGELDRRSPGRSALLRRPDRRGDRRARRAHQRVRPLRRRRRAIRRGRRRQGREGGQGGEGRGRRPQRDPGARRQRRGDHRRLRARRRRRQAGGEAGRVRDRGRRPTRPRASARPRSSTSPEARTPPASSPTRSPPSSASPRWSR